MSLSRKILGFHRFSVFNHMWHRKFDLNLQQRNKAYKASWLLSSFETSLRTLCSNAFQLWSFRCQCAGHCRRRVIDLEASCAQQAFCKVVSAENIMPNIRHCRLRGVYSFAVTIDASWHVHDCTCVMKCNPLSSL